MAVVIPAGIQDIRVRRALEELARELNRGSTAVSTQAADPDSNTPGSEGDIIFATGTNSIWVFVSGTWTESEGDQGPQGSFTVTIYIRSSSTPALPVGGTYVYDEDRLTEPTGWAREIGDLSGSAQLWFSEFIYNPAEDDNSITPVWSTPAEAGGTGPAGLDAINALLTVSNGNVFKNNAGAAKTMTVNVYVGGVEATSSEYSGYDYKWTYNDNVICIDTNRNVLSDGSGNPLVSSDGVTCAVGRPADSTVNTDVDEILRSIKVGPEDVNQFAKIRVEVSDIPD